MKRSLLALALAIGALASSACDESGKSPEARAGLRVPLPDGWKANSISGGLQVGPVGRVVLQLESTTRPFPDAKAFVSAVEGDGVTVMQKESVDTFLGVRYSMKVDDGSREAFLGVRQAGPRTIWCSTTGTAHADEVEAAMTVCRSLSWEG